MYIIKAKIYKLQENNRFNDAKERILGKNAQNFEHRGHHVRRFLNILKLTIHLDGRRFTINRYFTSSQESQKR